MFSRKKKATTFQEMFPDSMIQKSLEALNWKYGQSLDKPFEWVKLKQVEKDCEMLYVYLSLMSPKKRYGEYSYSRRHSTLERNSPKIKLRNKSNPILKLSAPLKVWIKKRSKEKQMVYKID